MNPGAPQSASARRASATALKPLLTHVELTWHEKKIEHWIRFGHPAHEQILDRRRRIVSFAPDAIFAFVRWASNDFGTIISRLDIVRAIRTGERSEEHTSELQSLMRISYAVLCLKI